MRRYHPVHLILLVFAFVVGELANRILLALAPAGPLKEVVLKPVVFGLDPPIHLNLLLVKFTLGLTFQVSIFAILMVLVTLFVVQKIL